MITNQQYQQAKQTIETAREQIREAKKITVAYEAQEEKARYERLLKLKKNDFVEYIGGTQSNSLHKGKKYRLTGESFSGRLAIINDAGRRIVVRPCFFHL